MSVTMNRRRFLQMGALAAAAAAWPRVRAASAPAWRGYAHAMVIDGLGGPGIAQTRPGTPLSAAALADVRACGLTACNLTVSGVGSYAQDYDGTVRNIAYWDGEIAAHPELLMQARSAADIAEAKRSGRLGLVYGFQDATPFGEELERLDAFWGLGVRIYQLTYNRRNLVGDGCLEPGNAGLSTFGRTLVERLNAKHALIDLAHSGQRTALEAIAASAQPVAISHTGCRALADLPRNKSDEELKRLADKGGVAGIYLMPFLRTQGQPMAADVVAHIEHALNVCGEDHVGVGTDGVISPVQVTEQFKRDFTAEIAERRRRGISAPGERADAFTFVPDLNTPRRFETLAALLAKRGHSDARIGKILGGNFARLFREVWGG
ncbi:MAG TPA: membrane dipeptidase [Mizugakiibacter sp.]